MKDTVYSLSSNMTVECAKFAVGEKYRVYPKNRLLVAIGMCADIEVTAIHKFDCGNAYLEYRVLTPRYKGDKNLYSTKIMYYSCGVGGEYCGGIVDYEYIEVEGLWKCTAKNEVRE